MSKGTKGTSRPKPTKMKTRAGDGGDGPPNIDNGPQSRPCWDFELRITSEIRHVKQGLKVNGLIRGGRVGVSSGTETLGYAPAGVAGAIISEQARRGGKLQGSVTSIDGPSTISVQLCLYV